MRFYIWYRFLWNVSKLNLHLVPIHPDHCTGLAFHGKSAYAFGPILFAQGAMLGSVRSGDSLMFTPKMATAKRKALADYRQVGAGLRRQIRREMGSQCMASEDVRDPATSVTRSS